MANTPWFGIDHLRFGIIEHGSLVAMVVCLMTKNLVLPLRRWLMTLGF